MKNLVVVFLTIGVCLAACSGGTVSSEARRKGATEAQNPGAPDSLSAAGEQELRSIVASGKLADLQWTNFSDDSARRSKNSTTSRATAWHGAEVASRRHRQ